ncbi:MAG: DUF4838 domain-containing protein [Verrucomicrobiota bacterium]
MQSPNLISQLNIERRLSLNFGPRRIQPASKMSLLRTVVTSLVSLACASTLFPQARAEPPATGTATPATLGLKLAVNGKPAFRIVVGPGASDSELLAVAELSKYLSQITAIGADRVLKPYYGNSPVAEGNQGANSRCIFIGWTEFAKSNGLDGSTMSPEEWALKSVGTNLILTGGRPRGTLYAVYDFLEKECGVHWFDRDTENVPHDPNKVMPVVDRRGKPQMWFRFLGANDNTKLLSAADLAAHRRFEIRNRCPGRQISFMPQLLDGEDPWNYNPDLGTPIWNQAQFRGGGEAFQRHCHSYFTYVPPTEFYAKHPEYYGFTAENAPKDLPKEDGGKLCLTNPDVRRIVKERLEKTIHDDRGLQRSFGIQAPRFYDLSMMDSSVAGTSECPCATCRAFVKAHGRESDLLIDFVNEVAASVGERYPDVTIATLAYYYNMLPPLKVKPLGNVMVEFCNWGGAPDGGPYLDQPLTHPDNKWRFDVARGWRDMGARLGVWDYLHYANSAAPVPMAVVPVSIGNQQFFKELGVEWFFEASEYTPKAPWKRESFASLRPWMACQQMADPSQSIPGLLDVFFSGYFGEAGGKMRAFYDLLLQCQEKPRGKKQLNNRAATLSYLTPEFYETAQRLFDEADMLGASNAAQQLRVRQERLRLDMSLLELWGDLERQLPDGVKLPYERLAVISRFEANGKAVLEGRSWSDRAGFESELRREVEWFRNPRLPKNLAAMDSREVCDVTTRYFVPWHLCYPKANEVMEDSGAALEIAMKFNGEAGWATHPIEFKVAGLSYKLNSADTSRDGQYHLYPLGRTRLLGSDQNFKLLVNGKVTGGLDLGCRINHRDSASEWDVSVSAKFVGPSFSKDSGDTDAILVDRIILVRSTPGFVRPEDEKAALMADVSTTLINAQAAEKFYEFPLIWKFRKDPSNEGESARWFEAELNDAWSDIRVDQTWNTQVRAKDYHGTAWYSLTFTAPDLPKKAGVSLLSVDLSKLYLMFGAVDGQCWIWLDGKPIGAQLKPAGTMWDKPFAFDLGSECIKPGQSQRLVVKVRKDTAAAGIYRPVELRVQP